MKKIIITVIAVIGLFSCKDKTNSKITPTEVGKVTFKIDSYANDTLFKLGDIFTTAAGDSFAASLLKFYVSEMSFRRKGSNEFVTLDDYYFLYDQEETEEYAPIVARLAHGGNSHISNVPVGEFDQIRFNVGIPQKRNHDTTSFEGVLSTTNNMYWDWSKEFIFFKFEGTSMQSPTKSLVFHSATDANLKRIIVNLDKPLLISKTSSPKLRLRFDVDKVFSAVDTISFKNEYSAMSGLTITKIANNYANCFSFKSIE